MSQENSEQDVPPKPRRLDVVWDEEEDGSWATFRSKWVDAETGEEVDLPEEELIGMFHRFEVVGFRVKMKWPRPVPHLPRFGLVEGVDEDTVFMDTGAIRRDKFWKIYKLD